MKARLRTRMPSGSGCCWGSSCEVGYPVEGQLASGKYIQHLESSRAPATPTPPM